MDDETILPSPHKALAGDPQSIFLFGPALNSAASSYDFPVHKLTWKHFLIAPFWFAGAIYLGALLPDVVSWIVRL